MTLLEQELAKLPNDVLRIMAASGVPETATAAQAELDSRPTAKPRDTDAWIRDVFPQRPSL